MSTESNTTTKENPVKSPREIAEHLILTHAQDVEPLSVVEYLEGLPGIDDLPDAEFDRLQQQVDDLIDKATVTVSFPEDEAASHG
jgi:hypothetical protein